eukprot:2644907-Lingulodinium_polyedra.AAC.1
MCIRDRAWRAPNHEQHGSLRSGPQDPFESLGPVAEELPDVAGSHGVWATSSCLGPPIPGALNGSRQ